MASHTRVKGQRNERGKPKHKNNYSLVNWNEEIHTTHAMNSKQHKKENLPIEWFHDDTHHHWDTFALGQCTHSPPKRHICLYQKSNLWA
jgi:hypothetical protein